MESGVYHRDIAPDNIRYLKSGWMKIMDLGGAKYSFQEQVNGPSRMIAVKKGMLRRNSTSRAIR